jgi:hypothetical protein
MSKTLTKKFSTRTFFTQEAIKELLKDSAEVMLYDVFGTVGRVTVGESNYGEFIKLLGDFRAINHQTGETIQTGTAILPDVIANMIYGQVEKSEGNIEFAFRVKANAANTPTGYEFNAETLIEAQEGGTLDRLQALAASQPLALPAPKKDGKKKAA